MRISNLLREKLSSELEGKVPLCQELNISVSTLQRWLYTDNDKFATIPTRNAITKLFGLTEDEMFEKEETVKL